MTNEAYYPQINRLLRFLTEEEAGYAFASVQDQRLIPRINEELLRRTQEAGKRAKVLFLRPNTDTPIPAQIRSSLTSHIDALIIPNLDLSLVQQGEAVWLSLNFSRELFHQLKTPTLIWASSTSLHRMANEAPDFFSQRAANTTFFGGTAPEPISPDLFEAYHPDRLREADVQTLKLKIGLLETQLKDAEAAGYSPTRLATDLALPLAKAYADVGRIEKVAALREAYWHALPQKVELCLKTGNLWFQEGNKKAALADFEKALTLARAEEDQGMEAQALGALGSSHLRWAAYELARSYLEQSLRIQREIGDKKGEGITLNNLSQIFKARGDYETALQYLEQSLRIAREIGDKSGEGTTLNNLATTAHARGDYETALQYLEQSLRIVREIGDKSGEGTTLNNISLIFKARGDYETALQYLEQSLRIQCEIGDKSGEGTTLNNISQIYDARGDYETALPYLEQSLRIQREIGDINGLAITLWHMGDVFLKQGKIEAAVGPIFQAYTIFDQIGSPNKNGTIQFLNSIRQQIGEARFEEIVAGLSAS